MQSLISYSVVLWGAVLAMTNNTCVFEGAIRDLHYIQACLDTFPEKNEAMSSTELYSVHILSAFLNLT